MEVWNKPGQAQTSPFLLLILTYLGLGHQCGGAITEWRERQAQLCLLVTLGKEDGCLRRAGKISGYNGRKGCCPFDLEMRGT